MTKANSIKKGAIKILAMVIILISAIWFVQQSNSYFHQEIPAEELAKLESELKTQKGCEQLYKIGQVYTQDGKITANEASNIRNTLNYCKSQSKELEATRKNINKLLTKSS